MLELVREPQVNSTRFLHWGIIDYEDALNEQMQIANEVYEHKTPNTVIFCSHEPIVTKGRATRPEDVFAWKGLTLDVQRGGRATYHGPNQLVVYPIINLQKFNHRGEVKITGIREFLKGLENIVVQLLSEYGIKSEGRCGSKVEHNDEALEATGVWVGSKKICSIGIAVKKWVTYHGIALNLDHDPNAFQGLNPCGFESSVMTSVEEIIGYKVSRKEITKRCQDLFSNYTSL